MHCKIERLSGMGWVSKGIGVQKELDRVSLSCLDVQSCTKGCLKSIHLVNVILYQLGENTEAIWPHSIYLT